MCSCSWASCCRDSCSCCLWNSAMRICRCSCCFCFRARSSCCSCCSRRVGSTTGSGNWWSRRRSMGTAEGATCKGSAEATSTAERAQHRAWSLQATASPTWATTQTLSKQQGVSTCWRTVHISDATPQLLPKRLTVQDSAAYERIYSSSTKITAIMKVRPRHIHAHCPPGLSQDATRGPLPFLKVSLKITTRKGKKGSGEDWTTLIGKQTVVSLLLSLQVTEELCTGNRTVCATEWSR